MSSKLSLLFLPLIIFLSACSGHYAADSHGYYQGGHYGGHHGSVSVGLHGHGKGAALVGALIVGGIIGHALTEASQREADAQRSSQTNTATTQIVNGYSLDPAQGSESQVEIREVSRGWYQLGQDGYCYLITEKDGQTEIISAVPAKKCGV